MASHPRAAPSRPRKPLPSFRDLLQKVKSLPRWVWITAGAVLFLIVFIELMGPRGGHTTKDTGEGLKVIAPPGTGEVTDGHTTSEIYLNFEQFKNKRVNVRGNVDKFGREGENFLLYLRIGKSDSGHRIKCVFDKNFQEKAETIRQGQSVFIRGLCSEKRSPNVTMQNCQYLD